MYHILAVSGTHVSFILIGITTFLSKFKVSKLKINVISLIFLGFFMFLTGFTASVIRACIMSGLSILSKLLHRKSNIINNLCFALLLSAIYNPYSLGSISVLLSYGGVIGIIYFLKIITDIFNKLIKQKGKIITYIKGIISVSISVQIIIIPIMICNYNTISLTFFISNILTSFLISIIIILGFVLAILSFPLLDLSKMLGQIYREFINLFLIIIEFTSKLPFSKIYVKTPYIWQVVMYYICVFVIRLFN